SRARSDPAVRGRTSMLKRVLLVLVAGAFVASCTMSTTRPQDATTAVDAASRAMGATGLQSIRYVASGTQYAVGQSFVPGAPWPRFNLTSLVRTVDYPSGSGREEMV